MAAYFAARDVMVHKRASGAIAVWAVRTDAIDFFWSAIEAPPVEVVHAPQAPNPNLAAQAGLFTVARDVHEDVGFETVLDKIPSKPPPRDIFRKLTLTVSQAPALMQRLARESVSAASMFPGYGGVVDSIREEEWYVGDIFAKMPVAKTMPPITPPTPRTRRGAR